MSVWRKFTNPTSHTYLPGDPMITKGELIHCALDFVTPAVSPNVRNLPASFVVVGLYIHVLSFLKTFFFNLKYK